MRRNWPRVRRRDVAVAAPADDAVVGVEHVVEVHDVGVAELRPRVAGPALADQATEQHRQGVLVGLIRLAYGSEAA